MPSTNDTNPTREAAVLVTLRWGDPAKVARYAAWNEDVASGGEAFLCTPKLEVRPAPLGGGVDQRPWELLISLTDSRGDPVVPVDAMCQGPHAPVRVYIDEVKPGDDTTLKKLFAGTVSQTTVNPPGAPGIAKVEVQGWKAKLAVALGVIAGPQCPWPFGLPPCGKDLAAIIQTGAVSAISVNQVTVGGITLNPTQGTWLNGAVYFDGLGLRINSVTGAGVFKLEDYVPAAWMGQTVTIIPGCSGTLKDCRAYDNEANFGGVGLMTIYDDPRFTPADDET